jgi:hypothetical protein
MTWSFFLNWFIAITLFTCFLQSQSHCYKGAITLRQGCNHPHAGFATVFFAIAAHQWLQPHCKGCCNHVYFHQVATTSSKHELSRNLTVSWHGAFLNWFFAIALLPFFCNRSHTLFFATVFLQSQHISGCNHTFNLFCNHMYFHQVAFLQLQHISGCNRTLSCFAITRIFTRLQQHQANTNLVAI